MQTDNKCLIVSQDSATRNNLKKLAEVNGYANIQYCYPARYKEHIREHDYNIIFLDIRELLENTYVVESALNAQKITNYFIIANSTIEDKALSLVKQGALGYFIINKKEDACLLTKNKEMLSELKNKNKINKDKAKNLISFYGQIEYLLSLPFQE